MFAPQEASHGELDRAGRGMQRGRIDSHAEPREESRSDRRVRRCSRRLASALRRTACALRRPGNSRNVRPSLVRAARIRVACVLICGKGQDQRDGARRCATRVGVESSLLGAARRLCRNLRVPVRSLSFDNGRRLQRSMYVHVVPENARNVGADRGTRWTVIRRGPLQIDARLDVAGTGSALIVVGAWCSSMRDAIHRHEREQNQTAASMGLRGVLEARALTPVARDHIASIPEDLALESEFLLNHVARSSGPCHASEEPGS
jgi:hypothetical protein